MKISMRQRKFNNAKTDEWLAWIATELESPRVGHAEDPEVVHVLEGFQEALKEIERLKKLWYADADPEETEYAEDYYAQIDERSGVILPAPKEDKP
jgi:hypothetical protein